MAEYAVTAVYETSDSGSASVAFDVTVNDTQLPGYTVDGFAEAVAQAIADVFEAAFTTPGDLQSLTAKRYFNASEDITLT